MQEKREKIILAYDKVTKNMKWLNMRARPWRERIRQFPVRTVLQFILNKWWNFLIYTLHVHSPLLSAKTFWGETILVSFPVYRSLIHEGLMDAGELSVCNFLIKRLKKGSIFLDVGANVGFYTLLAASLVGDEGKVYGFEPTPRTYEILKKNIRNKNNTVLVNKALTDKDSQITMKDFGITFSGLNKIFREEESKRHWELITAQATTMDNFCISEKVRPDIIKIDTEGAEGLVLQGGRETLFENKPMLIIEVSKDENMRSKTITDLTKIGYKAYQFDTQLNLSEYSKNHFPNNNMVFIHSGDSIS